MTRQSIPRTIHGAGGTSRFMLPAIQIRKKASCVITFGHLIYIPLVLMLGLILGWALGARGSQQDVDRLREELDALHKKEARRRLEASAERPNRKH